MLKINTNRPAQIVLPDWKKQPIRRLRWSVGMHLIDLGARVMSMSKPGKAGLVMVLANELRR